MVDTPITATLRADLPEARLAQLTSDLERDLSRAGIRARHVEAPAIPGERGEPITPGVLVLGLVTSGAVTALIGCFKAYLSRERALIIKLKCPGGTQLEVTARNVDTAALHEALKTVTSASSGEDTHRCPNALHS
jgi:hypothetical protein